MSRASSMNQLIRELRQHAQEHLLEPKWLLAPSLRVGHQWLETVVRSGQATVNFRVLTIPGFALELAGPHLAAQQKRLLTPSAGALLVDSILGRIDTTYLNRADRSPNLSKAIFASIQSLRLAGLGSDDLWCGQMIVTCQMKVAHLVS